MKKLFIILLLFLWISPIVFNIDINAQEDWVFDLGQFRENAYHQVLQSWKQEENFYEGSPYVFDINNQESHNMHLVFEDEKVYVPKNQQLTYSFNIESKGLYHIKLKYLIEESFSTQPLIELNVNNELPFNEMSGYPLDVLWSLDQRDEDEKYNRFGNELLPHTVSETIWYERMLEDPNGRYSEPLYFYLEQGINEISVSAQNQDIILSDLSILGKQETMDYQTYQALYQSEPKIDNPITIEGQLMTYKNDIEIKAGYHKGPSVTPSTYKTNVLNVLSGSSMQRSGLRADYTFNVEEAGLYQLNIKYLQRDMVGMSSARKILIDGVVPFEELNTYLFSYNRRWENHSLGQEGQPYQFYLEAGTHTLSLEVTSAHLTDYIAKLNTIMDRINSLGLAVTQITGNSQDALIDWDILKYIPTIADEFNEAADQLEDIYNEINDMTPEEKRAASISTLLIASKQLRRLAKHPNRIPNKLAELNIGSGSAYQLIGDAINQMNIQPLTIDYMNFYNDENTLDKANVNIFKNVWFSIQSFVYSFFDQRYRITSDPDDEILEVWIGQSTLYLDIMQNMIDDEFTRDTGIDVKLSVMPNTQRIILNNATETNPDVVLSIDSWEPYQYALRGMLADLSLFEDFSEMVEPYHPNNFTPMIFEEGVYGIPETQGLSLLFYRTDILSFLGVDAPDTWDDVIKILPILQSYQMNFFHPLGGEGAYKGFGLTAPFIYQFGGDIYHENGMSTTFNEESNIEAITFMTDIFNIYNLPQQVPNFFEHFRSGSLPVGVASIDLYLQLKYAAPELAGQWDILPIPGVFDESLNEVARWSPSYGKASILFENSKMKDEGFELIKWWNSADVQTKYLETIKMVLGERFLFLPANLDALENSIWDERVKIQSLEQARWSRIPAVTPGSYIVERELTNIWNKIVIDKMNPRIAIDQSIPRINRELLRKFEEFGYTEGGVIVREYTVPRNDNIEKWIN